MNITNFEFKAKVDSLERYEEMLLMLNPEHMGTDHQIDTYFNTTKGRLKLREGTIENALIDYDRKDSASSKESRIILYQHVPNEALKNILINQFGVKVIIDKKRKIYFLENIKFHFDVVEDLGTFIEVEAIDTRNEFTMEELKQQCNFFFTFFKLDVNQLIDKSYSDMLLELKR